MARKKKDQEIPVEEANVLPVMNIMFLLIPALLLAMEVASMPASSTACPRRLAFFSAFFCLKNSSAFTVTPNLLQPR